nr:fibronectin type III domain protein [uncultured bacterium]
MPEYRKIQIDVEKWSNTINVSGFKVYVRQIPESSRPEDYIPEVSLGTTDSNSRLVWDQAIAGKNYEFNIVAIDASGAELQEAPLKKTYFCNPPAPTAVGNIRVDMLETKIVVRWDASPSSESILKYELRRVDSAGTNTTWGSGLKIGETKDTQLETTEFPYDTAFCIMVAAWDGYKWSPVETYLGRHDRSATDDRRRHHAGGSGSRRRQLPRHEDRMDGKRHGADDLAGREDVGSSDGRMVLGNAHVERHRSNRRERRFTEVRLHHEHEGPRLRDGAGVPAHVEQCDNEASHLGGEEVPVGIRASPAPAAPDCTASSYAGLAVRRSRPDRWTSRLLQGLGRRPAAGSSSHH